MRERQIFEKLRFAREKGADPAYTALGTNREKEAFRSRWAEQLSQAKQTKTKKETLAKEEAAKSKRKYYTKAQLEHHYQSAKSGPTSCPILLGAWPYQV